MARTRLILSQSYGSVLSERAGQMLSVALYLRPAVSPDALNYSKALAIPLLGLF